MYDGHPAAEKAVARHLIRAILAKGYTASVHDGEVWEVKRSTSFTAIEDAIGNTDMDTVRARDASGQQVGDFCLIWGNAPDELISDYSDNPICAALAAEAVRFCPA
jgi:hypothetical protein